MTESIRSQEKTFRIVAPAGLRQIRQADGIVSTRGRHLFARLKLSARRASEEKLLDE
jgi:hypothetical protein